VKSKQLIKTSTEKLVAIELSRDLRPIVFFCATRKCTCYLWAADADAYDPFCYGTVYTSKRDDWGRSLRHQKTDFDSNKQ